MRITGASAWQPDPPPVLEAGVAPWRRYLLSQGYLDADLTLLLEGDGTDAHPGMQAAVQSELQGLEPDARTPEAIEGILVGYLAQRPPELVLSLPTAPERYLSPEQLGRRLSPTNEDHDLGAGYTDRMTGEPWIASPVSAPQAGALVVSSALLRVLGLAAPRWRIVQIGDRVLAAAPTPRAWIAGSLSVPELEAQAPADRWIAFDPTPRGRVRVRANPIPGLPSVVRWDLRGALGYSGASRRDPEWGLSLEAGDLGSAALPMLAQIDALQEDKIRRGVHLGMLPDVDAAALYGTLMARRELLRARLHLLTPR